ncbi:hypothetical protein ACFWI9_19875, partial [Streptomyces sp. NPDC127084]
PAGVWAPPPPPGPPPGGAPPPDRRLLEEPGRAWQPPAGYVTDPEIGNEPGEVCLDLERSLAVYCQHPAWRADREQQPAAGR